MFKKLMAGVVAGLGLSGTVVAADFSPDPVQQTIRTLRGNQEGGVELSAPRVVRSVGSKQGDRVVAPQRVIREYKPEWRPNAAEMSRRYEAQTRAWEAMANAIGGD